MSQQLNHESFSQSLSKNLNSLSVASGKRGQIHGFQQDRGYKTRVDTKNTETVSLFSVFPCSQQSSWSSEKQKVEKHKPKGWNLFKFLTFLEKGECDAFKSLQKSMQLQCNNGIRYSSETLPLPYVSLSGFVHTGYSGMWAGATVRSKYVSAHSQALCVYWSLSGVWLFATPWTAACQTPQSVEFSRQEYWSVLPLPSPGDLPDPNPAAAAAAAKSLQSCPTLCDPIDGSPPGSAVPGILQARTLE